MIVQTKFSDGKNTIIQSDVLEYLKTIESNSIDLIIADPPYFKVYGEFDFSIFQDEKKYIEWCKSWLIECKRILKNSGTLILYGSLGKRQITFAKLDNTKKYKRYRKYKKLYVSKRGYIIFN